MAKAAKAYKAPKSNDEVLLKGIIAEKKQEAYPDFSNDDFYEVFVAEQLLKSQDLGDDEILSGIVGNGGDGGIDAIYFFINGEIINEDIEDYSKWKKNVPIDIFIIQAKTSPTFSETTINKFIQVSEDIFTLDNDLDSKEMKQRYNVELLEIATRLQLALRSLASKFPTISFHYYYVSHGTEVHPNTKDRVAKLEKLITTLFKGAIFSHEFIGADKLLDIVRQQPSETYELKTNSPALSVDDNSYVAVCSLSEYYKFITDDQGKLRRSIFESNVRDYQGDVVVNKQIRDSLTNASEEDFWWLNNGVTILAREVSPKGTKTLVIEEPEIVNGLQTSNEIYNHFSSIKKIKDDPRGLLIRVIKPEGEGSRDRIIQATNSQTSIPQSSLRATDRIHRNIEDFLKLKGLYYDRRRNHYKNQGKPRSKIVSIPQLGQALMAILLRRPDAARARPSTLLAKDEEYNKIFNETHPIDLYYSVIQIMRQVDEFLKAKKIASRQRTNLRFYLAYGAVCEISSNFEPSILDIIHAEAGVDAGVLDKTYTKVEKMYSALGGDDKVAKGPQLVEQLYGSYKLEFLKKPKVKKKT